MEDIEVREKPGDMTREELMQCYKDNPTSLIEPMTDSEIKNMYQEIFCVVNELIFNNELPPIEIGYPSQDTREKLVHEDEDADAEAFFYFYRNKCKAPYIILGLQTCPEYGFTDDDIESLFHELIHYYCYLHNIQDVLKDTQYHNEQFRDTVIKFGGRCEYLDEEHGYSASELPDTLISEIVARIKA